jgi:hypothetical protein
MNSTQVTRIFAITALFAAASATATVAMADTEGAPRSRADVKAEALAAMKSGQLTAGEGSPVYSASQTAASGRTREERKAETMLARSRDELVHSGLATYRSSLSQQTATAKSTKARAERKAETMDAIRHKQMTPAGEA